MCWRLCVRGVFGLNFVSWVVLVGGFGVKFVVFLVVYVGRELVLG